MSVKNFKEAGIRFSYCIDCGVREIPSVQDVLYALHFSDRQEYYSFSLGNHTPYVENVHLVAASLDVGALLPYDGFTAREFIARAILELCPEEAKCVDYPVYSVLLRQADLPVPKHDPATCPHCNERHKRDNAPTDDFDWEEGSDDFLD
ncbi:MAG: hypothetical protein WCW31_02940 [Patescibacteria group bacterium]